jgi:hypothetical protein
MFSISESMVAKKEGQQVLYSPIRVLKYAAVKLKTDVNYKFFFPNYTRTYYPASCSMGVRQRVLGHSSVKERAGNVWRVSVCRLRWECFEWNLRFVTFAHFAHEKIFLLNLYSAILSYSVRPRDLVGIQIFLSSEPHLNFSSGVSLACGFRVSSGSLHDPSVSCPTLIACNGY